MDIVHDGFCSPAFKMPTELDKALLSLAATHDRLSWESLTANATIVLPAFGSSIRTIVTGRRIIPTGVYASRKCGRGHPYESMNERSFFMHSEVDTDIVEYRAQPFRLEAVIDGIKRAYIADVMRLHSNGTLEVVEIKSDQRQLRDPDYYLKLQAVRAICDHQGWQFKVLFKRDLCEPILRFQNVEDVQSWSFTDYGSSDVFIAVQYLSIHKSVALGDLAHRLGSRPVGIAKLKAMMVGRIVRLDLDSKLDEDSLVTLVSDVSELSQ
ncbi:TnsA endonuclease N-terminal domain-containing protein [Brevundimonas pishanensis]|uniref:TnsA endonuclease N-terminal domain-containing protein n=1 Tax=Brevundimonas pishanensis TaxID=2896315 RepID=UPI001FA7124B|nr:TnsA endonuclease N-terminal domain-containing protein [Brevundimonas pishanensis]